MEKGEDSLSLSLSESRLRLPASAQSDAVFPGEMPESLCLCTAPAAAPAAPPRSGVEGDAWCQSLPLDGGGVLSLMMLMLLMGAQVSAGGVIS